MDTGIIFGWDGVIVDSFSAHERSWKILADKNNVLIPQNFSLKSFGKCNAAIIADILGWTDDPAKIATLSEEKETIFRRIISEEGLEPLPGVRALLHALKEEQIPCAIVSSAQRKNIDLSLEILDLRHAFTTIITSENDKDSKLQQDIFLLAAEAIGRKPTECIVIENLISAVEIALSGKFKVAGIATTNSKDLLQRAGTHIAVDRMTEISLGVIRALQMQ